MTLVLQASHAHWPTLGKGLRPTLLLKPQLVQNRSCTRQMTGWIQNRQVNNPLAGAARNRGAADVFDAQLRRYGLDGLADPRGNLGHLWVVSTEFRRRRNVWKDAHAPVRLDFLSWLRTSSDQQTLFRDKRIQRVRKPDPF